MARRRDDFLDRSLHVQSDDQRDEYLTQLDGGKNMTYQNVSLDAMTSHVSPFVGAPEISALSILDIQVEWSPEAYAEAFNTDLTKMSLLPDELELSEHPDPIDLGLGLSAEQLTKEEEDEDEEYEDSGAVGSDNDSEFTLARAARQRWSRVSRFRRKQKLSSAEGVISRASRVHEREPSYRAPIRGSRAKSSQIYSKMNAPAKSFPCTFHHYGCSATFTSKNEWKRHVSSQHLQLGYYRCNLGTCAPNHIHSQQCGHNDFNRKDLFTQHCRRMHAPWSGTKKGSDGVSKTERENFEKQLEDIRARCWIDRRKPPVQSSCGFCGQTFIDTEEIKAWDKRMEHVGQHFEMDMIDASKEAVDNGLKQWAIEEGIIKPGRKKGVWWLVDYEPFEESEMTPERRERSALRRGKVESLHEKNIDHDAEKVIDIDAGADSDDCNNHDDGDKVHVWTRNLDACNDEDVAAYQDAAAKKDTDFRKDAGGERDMDAEGKAGVNADRCADVERNSDTQRNA